MDQYGTLSYLQGKVIIDRHGNVTCRAVRTTIRHGITRESAVNLVETIRNEKRLPDNAGTVFFQWHAYPEML